MLAMEGRVSESVGESNELCATAGLSALITLAKRHGGLVAVEVRQHPTEDTWGLFGHDARGNVYGFVDGRWQRLEERRPHAPSRLRQQRVRR